PDEILGFYRERGRRISIEKVAINAVMAGCLPEYFPVVLAIAEVLLDPRHDFHAANASTGSPAIGFIVNGPIRIAFGMHCRGYVRDHNVVPVFATGCWSHTSLHVEQRAEQIAETTAHQLAHLGRNTGQGWIVLVLTPEAARIVVRDGWSKAQLREAIYARAMR